MNKEHQLSTFQKTKIIVLHEEGYKMISIAKKVGAHRNTVSKWIDRHYEFGLDGLNRIEGTGKTKNKPDNNEEDELKMMELLLGNKFITLRELECTLQKEHNIKMSVYKIQQLLQSREYVYGRPPKRMNLTEEVKLKRKTFAMKYLHFKWTNVSFTDEASIWRQLKTLKRWYNTQMGIDHDVMFKHSDKLNVWCLINVDFKKIYVFPDNMDANKYVSILNEKFIETNNNRYLLCDNDPKHTSHKASLFLSKNKIRCIDFPSYSPDLNPIENIFSILKRNLQKRKIEITKQTFHTIIIEEWNKIDQQIIINTINSMPQRLKKYLNVMEGTLIIDQSILKRMIIIH